MATPEKSNVIIVIADDLGYGDLSCYGEKTIHTPAVDAFAKQGLRFTNAHTTAATCTPSRYSLLTGLYNWRRNDTGITDSDAAMVIRPEQTTIFNNALIIFTPPEASAGKNFTVSMSSSNAASIAIGLFALGIIGKLKSWHNCTILGLNPGVTTKSAPAFFV